MSHKAVELVYKYAKARGLARFVLVTLANHCNGKRNDLGCWPSLTTLMDETKLIRSTICKILTQLEAWVISNGSGQRVVGIDKLITRFASVPTVSGEILLTVSIRHYCPHLATVAYGYLNSVLRTLAINRKKPERRQSLRCYLSAW